MIMIKQSIYIMFAIVFCISCNEYELQETVMVYDTEHPYLPEYSEWGYNSFGAYFDREIFVSNTSIVPAKVIRTDSATTLLFSGIKGAPDIDLYHDTYKTYPTMSVAFTIPDLKPETYSDIAQLHNTSFDLTDTVYSVTITIDSIKYPAQILSGTFTCKRAQTLYVDTKLSEIILSGTFDFKAIVNATPITLSNGRYDVGIYADNFYVLQQY